MLDDIKKAILEIQQPRSRFQLEKFVLGQHATKEMQYYQVCLELQDMLYKYENAKLDMQITELKIEKLLEKNDAIANLKAEKLKLALEQSKVLMLGHEREVAHLVDLWASFSHKFSRAEIEAAQPDYWTARLTNNANAMVMGNGQVNPAHIEAMEQAGVLQSFIEKRLEVENEIRNLES